MRGGTVKQFKDALEEMRTIYPFNDETTRISTENPFCRENNFLTIITEDEKTGIAIQMSKDIPHEVF